MLISIINRLLPREATDVQIRVGAAQNGPEPQRELRGSRLRKPACSRSAHDLGDRDTRGERRCGLVIEAPDR